MTILNRRSFMSAAAAGSALAVLAARGVFGQEGPIRIGLLCPLSGPQAILGPSMQQGAQIMVDIINADGGVLGRQIELVVRDDSAKADQTLVAFRELLGEGVNFFLVGPYTGQILAIQPLLQESKAICISMGPVGLSLTHENFSPNYFRQNGNAFSQYHGQAKAMAERFPDVKKWAIINADLEAARDIAHWFTKGLTEYYPDDVSVAEPLLTKAGATDFRAQISQLMSSDAEGLVLGLFGADCISFLTQARGFGLDQKFKVIADTALSFSLPKAMKADLPQNLWVQDQWVPSANADNELAQAVAAEYVARTGDPDPMWHVGICAGVICSFVKGIETAGSTDVDGVIKALETTEVFTPLGNIRFRPEDHQAIDSFYHYVNVVPDAGSDKGWAIAEVKSVAATDLLEAPSPGTPFSG